MKGDKKKIVVLAALGVVILCVGAFQIMSSSSTAPAPAKPVAAKSDEKADEGTANEKAANNSATAEYSADESGENGIVANEGAESADPLRQLYSMNLSVRDPFASVTPLPITDTGPKNPAGVNPPRTSRGSSSMGGMTVPPFDPNSIPGGLPPIGGDPGALGAGTQPGLNLPPAGPAYSVSGVIRGEKNAAVIADAQGNQQLVREGQDIDGDAKVVSVQKNKVVIRKKDGKTITLSVGGNP